MIDCSKYTSKDIIKKVSSWDMDAFYCIVEKYEEKLLRYIIRISSVDLEEAENLLQEVFIKVYRNINSYNYKLSFSSWIYRITHNITIDFYRKNKNKINISLETEDEEYVNLIEVLDAWISLEKDAHKKELIEKITQILYLLDIKYRDILILKFLENKNYSEISDILKIPEWTVATLINRWKKQFKIIASEKKLNSYL